jgi:large subunit ribosomal protein L24
MLRIKKGDQVKILAGKDSGKTGSVLSVLSDGRVVVEGLNLVNKRMRPKQQGKTGEMVKIPQPVNASNVLLVCKNCKKAARVGFRSLDSKKVRYCKKCEATN